MNVPKLRFPGFEEEWVEKKVGDVFRFISTNSLSRENLNYESGEIKNIHYGDIHKKFNSLFDINKEQVPFINTDQKLSNITNDNYCIEGDLIFADASEDLTDVGKCIELINTNDTKIISGLHTIHARKIEDVFALGFTNFLMKTFDVRSKIMYIAQGSKVSSISPKLLGSIIISFPSLPEQQKIAEFLSSVDNVIQLLTKKKTLLENYKKGIMQKIFSQEIRFKDDNGNDFPEWEEKRLFDVSDRIRKKNNQNCNRILTISARSGLVSQEDFFNSRVASRDLSGYYLLAKDDFAYNKSYSNGYPMGAIKRLKLYDMGVVSYLYICFRFNQHVLTDFMEQYFEAGLLNYGIESVAQEGARNHGLLNISINDFFGILLLIPSLPEQQKIADFLLGIDRSIEIVNSQIEKAKEYKKGLLQQMFV